MGFEPRIVHHQGITLVQKRDPKKRPSSTDQGAARNDSEAEAASRVALVLAGGGISGAAYKAGGLSALDELFATRRQGKEDKPFGLLDFDIYAGISAGSVLATYLAAGLSPREIEHMFTGKKSGKSRFRPWHFMWPNVSEVPGRVRSFLSKEQEILTNYLSGATSTRTGERFKLGQTLGKMVSASSQLVPTGLFNPKHLESFLEASLAEHNVPSTFEGLYAKRQRGLYMTATDLNHGRLVVFGHDEPYANVPLSQAMVASCALPLWYRPVRIQNPRAGEPGEPESLDFADGSILRTANIRLAVEKGADLVICYNPFTHIVYDRLGRSLYEHGAYAMASQVVRLIIGARLQMAKELIYSSEDFNVDVLFIEPAPDDYDFFLMNPMNFWTAERAAEHGYRRVGQALRSNSLLLSELFAGHGIRLRPLGSTLSQAGAGQTAQTVDLRESKGVSQAANGRKSQT